MSVIVLISLELKDFAIVDELRVELSPGFNALTGETGAGKSLLVDALALLTGQRGDSSFVRSGAKSALVQGEFSGVGVESASRRLRVQGRSQARIDGELVTIAELAGRLGRVVGVHGQHAAQALTGREEPRLRLDRLLDEKGRELLREYEETYRRYESVRGQLAALREGVRERERRRDFLRFELEEIDSARLQEGEDVALRQRIVALRNSERIMQATAGALALLNEGEPSASELLHAASRELHGAARHQESLAALAAELDEARAAVQAVGEELESFIADFEGQPGELDRAEERLATIDRLRRKYGEDVAAILAYRQEAAHELQELEEEAGSAGELEAQLTELEATVRRLGAELTGLRTSAARGLQREVEGYLGQLSMAGARLTVVLEPLDKPGPHGLERVRFDFSANPGEPLADLSQVGSGGELSRVMLALDLVTGTDRPVLVFDEVDAGIGGQAARAVGELLARLSRKRQVLVVTHLPQVAAYADAQFFVEKVSEANRTVTRVHRLEPHEREQELARMLSGSVTEASLRNARELMEHASGESGLGA